MRWKRLMVIVALFSTAALAAPTPGLMATKVVVEITGLVSIADATAATGGPKTMYLIDARAAHPPMVQHLPIVIAHDDMKPTALDGTRPLIPRGKFHYLEFGNAEELRFDTVNLGASPLTYSEAPPANVCATVPERKSLYFLPHLKRTTRKGGGIPIAFNDLDPDYTKPDPAKKLVAAFMSMPYGTLQCVPASDAVWEFKESPNSFGSVHRQLIAEILRWTFFIDGNTLTLSAVTTSGLKPLASFTPDGSGSIQLTIANAPSFGIDVLAGLQAGIVQQPSDEHFAMYYDFVKDKTVKRYLPVIAGVCVDDGSGGLVMSVDPCELRRVADVPDPGNCTGTPPQPLVGGINCGPDGMP